MNMILKKKFFRDYSILVRFFMNSNLNFGIDSDSLYYKMIIT